MNEPQKPKDEDELKAHSDWGAEFVNWNPDFGEEEPPSLYSIAREDHITPITGGKFRLAKIRSIAQLCTPQEMFAALVWQRRFNNFNGEQVITDLFNNQSLWHSFLFSKGIYPEDSHSLSFTQLVTTLLAMANYRTLPETSPTRFIAYPADNLYVLTVNESTLVSELIDLGKKWQADSVEVVDRHNREYGTYIYFNLRECLVDPDKTELNQPNSERADAVVVSYWWD